MSTSSDIERRPVATVEPEKAPLPVAYNIITDKELGILKGVKLQPVDIAKTIKLLTDPHSMMMYERHVHSLNRLIKHYKTGFLMKDLIQVFKIINVCADRVMEHPEYEKPVRAIINICGLPFLKEKTSDEALHFQTAIDSISHLGYLMRIPSTVIRTEICNTLLSFYVEQPPQHQVIAHQQSTKPYNMAVVETSDVAESLVKSLALLESELEVRLLALEVLQGFSATSQENANKMLSAEAASRICCRFNDPDPSGRLLFRSVEILWNLCENGDKSEVARQMNSITCINSLKDAFELQVTRGYSHYDRQMRNDILVITMLVASYSPNAPFVETGFGRQIIQYATFQEVKSYSALTKRFKLGTNHEDFELKKLLMSTVTTLSKEPTIIPLLSEGHMLLALLYYVRSNEVTSGPQEFSKAQFEELQLHAMDCLCTLSPLCIEDYMTCQGNTRLLLLLDWCIGHDGYKGHGNSFHGRGGYGSKRAQMRYCLRIIRSMVSIKNDQVNQDLCDQGAINQITQILSNASHSDDENDDIDVEMQCDMLFIISSLCEGNLHRKELFGSQGVEVMTQYLRKEPEKACRGLGHHRLMVYTVDCIWSTISGCFINEDLFLETEGMFLLLDLLEGSAKNLHNLILGCVLDLCENPKAIPHIMMWRGADARRTVPNLFVDIWRKEEEEMGVKRKPNGIIQDVSKPLMGGLQEEQGVMALPATSPSLAIVDVSENMRAKIYALFSKIGFNDLPGLETKDYIVLTIIEKYLDFKLGEVWREIMAELEKEDIRPISSDREALETISRVLDEEVKAVAETQEDLLENQLHQDLLDEQEMYAEIRENNRHKEKAIRDWEDYISRTSNYDILKRAKTKLELSIKSSRILSNYREMPNFHSLEQPRLQTTTFQGRKILIESTPYELTGGPLVTLGIDQPPDTQMMEKDKNFNVTLKEPKAVVVSQ